MLFERGLIDHCAHHRVYGSVVSVRTGQWVYMLFELREQIEAATDHSEAPVPENEIEPVVKVLERLE